MNRQYNYLILLICFFVTGCAPKPEAGVVLGAGFGDLAGLGNLTGLAIGSGVLSSIYTDIDIKPTDLTKTIKYALEQGQQTSIKTMLGASSSLAQHTTTPWKIAESNEGVITTEWRPIIGRTAGMLWWEKTYLSEVRHIITVTRSYKSPDLSNLKVDSEVRERPNEKYPWTNADKKITDELSKIPQEEIKGLLSNSIRSKIVEKISEESAKK